MVSGDSVTKIASFFDDSFDVFFFDEGGGGGAVEAEETKVKKLPPVGFALVVVGGAIMGCCNGFPCKR